MNLVIAGNASFDCVSSKEAILKEFFSLFSPQISPLYIHAKIYDVVFVSARK